MRKAADYRVAIVGCGRIAGSIDDEIPPGHPILPYCHAAGYAAVGRARVMAAADINEERLSTFRSRWKVEKAYRDWREMIDRERPDLVSVCTGGTLHAEITIFAAEHGVKGIYCEKAMACSMAEADAMLEAIERNGVAFNLGVLRRFDQSFIRARSLIQEGELGRLTWLQFTGNDLLMHGYSHAFDAICFLAGDPAAQWIIGDVVPYSSTRVAPLTFAYDPTSNRFDRDPGGGWAVISFAEGTMGNALNTFGMPMYEWQIVGIKGVVHIRDNGGSALVLRKGEGYDKPEVPCPVLRGKSPTVTLIEDLIQAMETGKPTVANARASRAVTELCLANAQSHLRGAARVELPLANRALYIPSH